MVFISFELDLQISLNGFENKQIKEKKESLPVFAGGLEAPVGRPTLPFSALLGQTSQSRLPLFLASRGPARLLTARVLFSL
jgi:hypothetical protein